MTTDISAHRQLQLAAAAALITVLGDVIASCPSSGTEFGAWPTNDEEAQPELNPL